MDNTNDELSSITNRNIYIHNFDKNENELKNANGKFITPYQFEKAREIYNFFISNSELLNLLMVAETQMGKTGIIQALTRIFVEENNIDPLNILILTGLSSTEWVKQTQNRFIDMIRPNIFHRNTMHKFQEVLKTKNNLLLILDEVHIASELKNNMGKIFKECGLLNINNLNERNIKFIQVSATPDATLTELYKWNENNRKVFIVKSPENYIGIEKLLKNGQILEYNLLTDINNVREIRYYIENKYTFNNYKYHLIRINTSKRDNKLILDNINAVFKNDRFYIKNFCITDTEKLSINDDLNELYLDIKPRKRHTIILLKEKVRCSYTINKTYLGILYERKATDQSEMTIIQGLAGRGCGYFDNTNKELTIFTNIEIIKKYIEKIKQDHNYLLYENNNKKKNINDRNTNYNDINNIIDNNVDYNLNNIDNNTEFNVIVIDDIDEMDELVKVNNKSRDVYNDIIFNKILKKKGLKSLFNSYEQHNKLTYTAKSPHILIKKKIDDKNRVFFTDVYHAGTPQYEKYNKSKNVLITIVNKYQNEIYLIFFDKN
jgi:hypothetical protein